MRKITMTALLAATALARPYNNGGWKMDGDKIAVDTEGNPIYINGDGREMTMRPNTIATLSQEAKDNRVRAEAAEGKLEAFKGLDPAVARDAIDKVGKIDSKALIDAGEVDKVRDSIKTEYEAKIAEKDAEIAASQARLDRMTIDRAFDRSDFVRDQLAVPVDMFQETFRNRFKVEGDKIVAYDASGNVLNSKKHIGEIASFDEALELTVDAYPHKDRILRAPDAGGTGGNSGAGNRGQSRVMKRSDFASLAPAQQAAAAAKQSTGELTIID